jgi:hypothetical protein
VPSGIAAPPRSVCATSSASRPTAASARAGSSEGSGASAVSCDRARAADVGGEAIAAAPHGLDQLGIAAVGFHLAPQAADLVVDRAVEQVRLAALDHVEQPVAVEHLARMAEERDEQAELGRGQRHDRAFGVGQPALERIEQPALELVERVLLGGALGCLAERRSTERIARPASRGSNGFTT